jgi:hypothetical protein
MVGITDLGDLTEEIEIRGKKLRVQGIPAEDWVKIFSKFPVIAKLLDKAEVRVDANLVKELTKVGPDALGTILSFVSGGGDDPKQIAYARRLGVGDQLKILHKGFKLTFWDGTRPFVEQLEELTTAIWMAQQAPAQAPSQASQESPGRDSDLHPDEQPDGEVKFTAQPIGTVTDSVGQSQPLLSAALVGEVSPLAGHQRRAS